VTTKGPIAIITIRRQLTNARIQKTGGQGWAKWWRFRLDVRLEHSAEIIAEYLPAERIVNLVSYIY